MSRISGILLGTALFSTAIGCTKKDTDDRADSSTASAAVDAAPVFDKAASIAAIHANNDLWLRSVTSRNLDSLMSMYASDAVSMSEGAPAAKGADAVRTSYAAFFKANPGDPKLDQHDAVFSDDGTLGWDEGTFTGTVDVPGGKPMKLSSDYLSVWKRDGGAWKIVREITNSNTTPTK
ncbi:MAG: nuclear transport factor 2 family protein [Gemmatimonadaceae bacterium]